MSLYGFEQTQKTTGSTGACVMVHFVEYLFFQLQLILMKMEFIILVCNIGDLSDLGIQIIFFIENLFLT